MCNCAQKPNDENSKTAARSPLSSAPPRRQMRRRRLPEPHGGNWRPTTAARRQGGPPAASPVVLHRIFLVDVTPGRTPRCTVLGRRSPPLRCRRHRLPPPGLLRGQRTQIITTTGRQGLPAKSSEVPYFVTIAWYVVSMPIMDGNNPFQSCLKRFVFMQDFLDN